MHRSIWRLALVGALPIFAAPTAGHAGCGTATCPLDLNRGHSGKLRLQTAFEYIAQDRLRAGNTRVAFGHIRRPDHNEIETINRNLLLSADYALNSRWALAVALPLIQRRHSHIAAPGHRHDHDHESSHSAQSGATKLADRRQDEVGYLQEWRFTRPGDLVLWGRFKPTTRVEASLGISAPTGATAVRNDDGYRAEPSLQPGRGAWGLLFEASYEHVSPHRRGQTHFFASTAFRTYGRSRQDYRFGDEWLVYAGGGYLLTAQIELLGQLSVVWRNRDQPGHTGEYTDATGGYGLYASPGVRRALGAHMSLYGYYQVPLYEYLNQIQLTADRNLLFGLDCQLDVF